MSNMFVIAGYGASDKNATTGETFRALASVLSGFQLKFNRLHVKGKRVAAKSFGDVVVVDSPIEAFLLPSTSKSLLTESKVMVDVSTSHFCLAVDIESCDAQKMHESCVSAVSPLYCIGFRMMAICAPTLYAAGMPFVSHLCDHCEYDEPGKYTTSWMKEYRDADFSLKDSIRGWYEYNYFSGIRLPPVVNSLSSLHQVSVRSFHRGATVHLATKTLRDLVRAEARGVKLLNTECRRGGTGDEVSTAE